MNPRRDMCTGQGWRERILTESPYLSIAGKFGIDGGNIPKLSYLGTIRSFIDAVIPTADRASKASVPDYCG